MSYYRTSNKSDCCGCTACVNACPKSCISFITDKEGFQYPQKNINDCIECGLCEKVCPFSDNYSYQTTSNPGVFAAYDKINRQGSSSGGLFYTIAKYVIEELHGWVFGASFDSSFKLKHIGVNNISQLDSLRGSKYVQSNLNQTLVQIKTLLGSGVFVFFVGTPCQVAGLRAYLRKEYNNLLTADLVCHGVPSQLLFDEHIHYLEKKQGAKLTRYSFRDNNGWGGCEISEFSNGKKIKKPTYELSPYLYSFMYSMTYRESCYECRFSKIPRQGDITLADYWGAKECFPEMDVSKGVSMILVNTSNGENIWNKIKNSCCFESSNIFDAAKHNSNLVTKSKRPAYRDLVYEKIRAQGYDKVARTDFVSPRKTRIVIEHSKIYKFAFSMLYPIYKKRLKNNVK